MRNTPNPMRNNILYRQVNPDGNHAKQYWEAQAAGRKLIKNKYKIIWFVIKTNLSLLFNKTKFTWNRESSTF
jgi:hypothetical protein